MSEVEQIRERLDRIGQHLGLDDLDPEIDVQRLGEEPLKAIYAAIDEIKDAVLELLWLEHDREEDRLRALGIDPEEEGPASQWVTRHETQAGLSGRPGGRKAMNNEEAIQACVAIEKQLSREGDAAISLQEIVAAVRSLAGVARALVEMEVNVRLAPDQQEILFPGGSVSLVRESGE